MSSQYEIQRFSTQEYQKLFPYTSITGIPFGRNIDVDTNWKLEKNTTEKTLEEVVQKHITQMINLEENNKNCIDGNDVSEDTKINKKSMHPVLAKPENNSVCKDYGTSSSSSSWTYYSSNDSHLDDISKKPIITSGITSITEKKKNKDDNIHKELSNAIEHLIRSQQNQNEVHKEKQEEIQLQTFGTYGKCLYPKLIKNEYSVQNNRNDTKTLKWLPEWIYLIFAILLWIFITQGIKAIKPDTYNNDDCSTSQYIRMWICFVCTTASATFASIYFEGGSKVKLPLMLISTVFILLLIHPKPLLCHVNAGHIKHEAATRALLSVFLLLILIIVHMIKKHIQKKKRITINY